MEPIHILLFYKYVSLNDLEGFRAAHLAFCQTLGLRGRILIAYEGINGSVSGTQAQVGAYQQELRRDARFRDIVFKEDRANSHPFKKMIVKVKKEIVNFGIPVDLSKTGEHISPQEFLDIYSKNKNVVILDARNEYEARVGKFRNAVTLPIKTFREFPEKVLEILGERKDQKIVMYCTGGIRCEKASAYLREKGFQDVSQLDGGILTFGKAFPDSVWDGVCFVFDKRMTSAINDTKKPITCCELCNTICDLYKNCANFNCDRYCVVCIVCEQAFGGCCSRKCFEERLHSPQSSRSYGAA